MPVPAGAISLEKSSRAFFCLWWTAIQITASLEPCKHTRSKRDRNRLNCNPPDLLLVKQKLKMDATQRGGDSVRVQWRRKGDSRGLKQA